MARPQYDPYGWLLWGREILHGSLSTSEYPSWKPLGALLALPAALAGSSAPAVWLVLERTLSLLGLVLAYLVGSRLGGRWAGLLAAAGVVFVTGWLSETLDGHLEPVVAAALLGAVWLDSANRRRWAFGLLYVASLARPEAWPLLGLYAVLLARAQPRRIPWLVLALASVPVLWFGGDILGSGSAFRGGDLARESTPSVNAGRTGWPGFYAFTDGVAGPLGLLFASGTAMFVVGVRRRERSVIAIGVAVLSWLFASVVLAASGYPVDPRFVMPEAVLVTVLGAVGLVRGLRWLVATRGVRWRTAALAGAAAALAASAVPAIASMRADVNDSWEYGRDVGTLARVTAQFQANGLMACHPSVSQPFQAPFAWYTHRAISQINQPLPDSIVLTNPRESWTRLGLLETAERRIGGFKFEHLRPTGFWHPVVLEPRRRAADARVAFSYPGCDTPAVSSIARRRGAGRAARSRLRRT